MMGATPPGSWTHVHVCQTRGGAGYVSQLNASARVEEDMARFMSQLQDNRQQAEAGSESEPATPSDEAIVDQLRRSKTETAYAEWVADLKKKYPVDINQAVLSEVLAESADAGQRAANDARQE